MSTDQSSTDPSLPSAPNNSPQTTLQPSEQSSVRVNGASQNDQAQNGTPNNPENANDLTHLSSILPPASTTKKQEWEGAPDNPRSS
jgi:hypothetical protein